VPLDLAIIVCARDEANTIAATLAALPPGRVIVVDDGSRDATAAVAERAGAEVIRTGRRAGKGGAASLAAARVGEPVVLLCDADLGASAAALTRLVDAVRDGEADLAVGAFARREGGGFGIAVGFARWVVRRRCGLRLDAPISGQRALSRPALEAALPFAPRFGMEVGMTIDVASAGLRVREYELALMHRVTGRTLGGFVHRARQLVDFAIAARSRPRGPARAASRPPARRS
jgi:glycosyltransferase involved in cell wall biosynthesis